MTAEILPHTRAASIDVVTLFAPHGSPREDFEREVSEWRSLERAVLVVLPAVVDTATIERLTAAGADLCVVAPTSNELFTHVERARLLHRRASRRAMVVGTDARAGHRSPEDDVLDNFWRTRDSSA